MTKMKKSTIISMACAAVAVCSPLASNAQTVAADSVMQHNEEKFDLPEVGQATVNVSSSDKEMQKVAKVYVNQVVYPTFLQAVAADVRNITALLEFTWMGSAASNETKSVLSNASYVFSSLRYNGLAANGTMCYGQFLLSPSVTTGYNLWQGTVRQIFVGGCSNICAEVADLTAALNNAIQAPETAKNSGKSFVETPGAQHVKDCIDAVSALDEELNKAGDWVNKQEAL